MFCRHERYLGMWADDLRCGPGMIVSSTGTYCEATFASGAIAVSCVPTYVGPVVLFRVPDLILCVVLVVLFQVPGLIPCLEPVVSFHVQNLIPCFRSGGLVPCPKSHSLFRARLVVSFHVQNLIPCLGPGQWSRSMSQILFHV